MNFRVTIHTTFNCSLERAFKTPMLCDVSKVHTGFGMMPLVTHCTDDEHWGQPGSSKRVFAARSLGFAGGEASMDHVITRTENEYWKIAVTDFKAWMLGFYRFEGEWRTREVGPEQVWVEYTYTLFARAAWLLPLQGLFIIFWRIYMRRVLENVRMMAYAGEPYLYP